MIPKGQVAVVVVVVVVVEASAPKVYPRVGGKDLVGWKMTS